MEPWEREKAIVEGTEIPITKKRLTEDLSNIGLLEGDIVITHFAMSKIGWIVGGEITVIDALMEVLSEKGTLVMPSQTRIPGEPSGWKLPAVPESWWQIIRDEAPVYDPRTTPTHGLGRIPETFRSYPGVLRSAHPQAPFTAWGKHAQEITDTHQLEHPFGKRSPLETLFKLGGKVLLLGVGHINNTSLHYAESIADIPNFPMVSRGAAIISNDERIWKTWEEIDNVSEDFPEVGEAFEKTMGYRPQKIGQAESRLLPLREMINFAKDWFEKNRKYS